MKQNCFETHPPTTANDNFSLKLIKWSTMHNWNSFQSNNSIQADTPELWVSRIKAETSIVRMEPSEGHPKAQLDGEAFACTARGHRSIPRHRMERPKLDWETISMCFVDAVIEKLAAGKFLVQISANNIQNLSSERLLNKWYILRIEKPNWLLCCCREIHHGRRVRIR